MRLSGFIRQYRDPVIARWSEKVVERLGLELDQRPLLVNDLPELLRDLIEALDVPPETWSSTSARAHARQRIKLGVDIGGLSEEIGIVGETVLEIAAEQGCAFDLGEVSAMCRMLARGTAESVTEYARLRDAQLAREAARHVSFIAHELRTPLQSAVLAVELLPIELGPLVGRLKRAHQQLVELVDNSLVEARLATEPMVDKKPIAGRELVDGALLNSEALAQQRGIELKAECDDVEVEVDRRLLVSALTNLVINAIKFTPGGKEVVLRLRVKEERVHFEVADGCGGIPQEALPNLFRPYAQEGSDRTGFGLGLMIVKQVVEAHGGSVRVVNHEGHGCCFVLDLPRRRSRLSRTT